MFDWLKRKELEKIDALTRQLDICESKVSVLEGDIRLLDARLSDARKIANSKKVIKCSAKNCMDWENGTCTLGELIIKTDGKEAFCMDYDAGSVMEELKSDGAVSIKLNPKLFLVSE